MTDLVRAGTHTAYLVSGSVFGIVIFLWTALAAWLARFFPGATRTPDTVPSQTR
jgi:predicted Abi (CAAX) family protease